MEVALLRFEKRDYQDDDALDALAHRIQSSLPELIEATESRFRAFYSSVEPDHIGGKCRKLDGAVRHRTGDDYWLLIHQDPFLRADDLHKFRILVHEIHHIAKEGNSWVIRRHSGDFCEIPEHDRYSYRLALKALVQLGVKYTNAEEAKKYAGID